MECWSCGKPLPKGWMENNSCDECAAPHLKHQEELEQSYQEAKEARYHAAVEERENWREERREERVQAWVEAKEGRSAFDYPWGGIARH